MLNHLSPTDFRQEKVDKRHDEKLGIFTEPHTNEANKK
jgi:hypothetical protein